MIGSIGRKIVSRHAEASRRDLGIFHTGHLFRAFE
jgi:hypothetical protein